MLSLLLASGARRTPGQPTTFAGNAQHTGLYDVPAQHLDLVYWSTAINLHNTGAYTHYGAPLITAANTVLVPIKTTNGFLVSAFEGTTGRLKYTLTNDYRLPPTDWGPVYQPVIATPELSNLTGGANVTNLSSRFDSTRYLSPHSDLVALLVLEHQVRMENLITHANYETRLALDQLAREWAVRETSAGDLPTWVEQRIAIAGELLLEYMLFRDEAPLEGPGSGTSKFASEFQRRGPRASKDRSLHQLDLHTRLLRYPCSFLIYSSAFDALPREMKNYLWGRLDQILSGKDTSPSYATISERERQDVLEILKETKPEFAAWLRSHPPLSASTRGQAMALK